jgi:hypothetical protein
MRSFAGPSRSRAPHDNGQGHGRHRCRMTLRRRPEWPRRSRAASALRRPSTASSPRLRRPYPRSILMKPQVAQISTGASCQRWLSFRPALATAVVLPQPSPEPAPSLGLSIVILSGKAKRQSLDDTERPSIGVEARAVCSNMLDFIIRAADSQAWLPAKYHRCRAQQSSSLTHSVTKQTSGQ